MKKVTIIEYLEHWVGHYIESPEYHSDIRVQVGNYIEANRSHFEDFIYRDFNQYVSLIRDTDY